MSCRSTLQHQPERPSLTLSVVDSDRVTNSTACALFACVCTCVCVYAWRVLWRKRKVHSQYSMDTTGPRRVRAMILCKRIEHIAAVLNPHRLQMDKQPIKATSAQVQRNLNFSVAAGSSFVSLGEQKQEAGPSDSIIHAHFRITQLWDISLVCDFISRGKLTKGHHFNPQPPINNLPPKSAWLGQWCFMRASHAPPHHEHLPSWSLAINTASCTSFVLLNQSSLVPGGRCCSLSRLSRSLTQRSGKPLQRVQH